MNVVLIENSTIHKACIAVTYPLDLTKTRLQIQGERSAVASTSSAAASTTRHHGMFRIAVGIGALFLLVHRRQFLP